MPSDSGLEWKWPGTVCSDLKVPRCLYRAREAARHTADFNNKEIMKRPGEGYECMNDFGNGTFAATSGAPRF